MWGMVRLKLKRFYFDYLDSLIRGFGFKVVGN